MMDEKSKGTFHGVCHFFSETGTEGGYWAFQDEAYIRKNVPMGFCKKCGVYLENKGRAKELSPENNYCPDGACEEKISDAWSYEGLHILEDGDQLAIYDKNDPSQQVWSGSIKLLRFSSFDDRYNVFGFRIHADQEGENREVWARWFFEEYPAKLVVA